jgi:hypothetical protein
MALEARNPRSRLQHLVSGEGLLVASSRERRKENRAKLTSSSLFIRTPNPLEGGALMT